MSIQDKPFFIGYMPIPGKSRSFLMVIAVSLIGVLATFGLITGSAQDDPGTGAFRYDYGRQTVTGVIELMPYPLLRVTKGNGRIKPGHTLMLTASGKASVMSRAKPFAGKLAKVSGVILQRGNMDMLQLRGGKQGISAAKGDAPELTSEPLGRWRLAGEINDGKCLAGAMRPGSGLAHKACASLCLLSGTPPVFVSSQPVKGSEFFLISGPDGGPLPEPAYDFVGQYISLEGEIVRRGDLLVLQIDTPTMQVVE